MSPGRFYALCAAGCLGGWAWIALAMGQWGASVWKGCLMKQLFHIPCPACGSTRAIVALLEGHVRESLAWNPLGLLLFLLLLLLTVGLPYDGLGRHRMLYGLFQWVDARLHHKGVFALVAGLVLLNWWWIW